MGKAERAKQEAVEGQSEGMFLGLGMQERLPKGRNSKGVDPERQGRGDGGGGRWGDKAEQRQ